MEKPKIRFLKNKHSWVRNTFEEIAKRRTKSSDNPDLPRIEYQDIISGEGRLNKDLNKNIDCRKGIVFETNDILYGKLRPYLKNWLHPNFNGIALGDFWVLQARNCDSKFLFSLVQSPKFQRVANDTSGTKMPRSDWKTVSQTEFSIPTSNEEQSAIGSLFRTLDDLLSSYKDNLANYQSLKATMLSKMFPKAGQTVPEIRLDGFERKWEKKKLIDIVSPVSRKVKKPSDPYYRLSIRSHAKGTFKQFVDDPKKIAMDNLFEVKENDLVVNITFAWEHAIAVASKEDDGLLVSHRFPTYVIDKSDKNFINIYIKREEFRQKMDLLSPGGAGRNRVLNVKDFINIQMVVPELKEQQAIGAYFSNLDNLITAHQEKIFQFETLKKKLLQDMFI